MIYLVVAIVFCVWAYTLARIAFDIVKLEEESKRCWGLTNHCVEKIQRLEDYLKIELAHNPEKIYYKKVLKNDRKGELV